MSKKTNQALEAFDEVVSQRYNPFTEANFEINEDKISGKLNIRGKIYGIIYENGLFIVLNNGKEIFYHPDPEDVLDYLY